MECKKCINNWGITLCVCIIFLAGFLFFNLTHSNRISKLEKNNLSEIKIKEIINEKINILILDKNDKKSIVKISDESLKNDVAVKILESKVSSLEGFYQSAGDFYTNALGYIIWLIGILGAALGFWFNHIRKTNENTNEEFKKEFNDDIYKLRKEQTEFKNEQGRFEEEQKKFLEKQNKFENEQKEIINKLKEEQTEFKNEQQKFKEEQQKFLEKQNKFENEQKGIIDKLKEYYEEQKLLKEEHQEFKKEIRKRSKQIETEGKNSLSLDKKIFDIMQKKDDVEKLADLKAIKTENLTPEEKAELYFRIGYVSSNLKEYIEAINYFDKVLEINEKDAAALNNRGSAKYNLKKLEAAELDYKMSLEYEDDITKKESILVNLSLLKEDKNDYLEAIQYIDEAIKLGVEENNLYNITSKIFYLFLLGEKLIFSKNKEKGVEKLKESCKIGEKTLENYQDDSIVKANLINSNLLMNIINKNISGIEECILKYRELIFKDSQDNSLELDDARVEAYFYFGIAKMFLEKNEDNIDLKIAIGLVPSYKEKLEKYKELIKNLENETN